jgi:hypothetical protein
MLKKISLVIVVSILFGSILSTFSLAEAKENTLSSISNISNISSITDIKAKNEEIK